MNFKMIKIQMIKLRFELANKYFSLNQIENAFNELLKSINKTQNGMMRLQKRY